MDEPTTGEHVMVLNHCSARHVSGLVCTLDPHHQGEHACHWRREGRAYETRWTDDNGGS